MRRGVPFLLLLTSISAFSQIQVNLIPPELNDGLDNLEALLETETYAAVADIQLMVDDTVNKELFFRSIGDAHSMVIGLPSFFVPSEQVLFGYSIQMGIQSYDWAFDEIEGRLETMEVEDDLTLGAGATPLNFIAYIPLLEAGDFHGGLSLGYGYSEISVLDVNALNHQGWTYGVFAWLPQPGPFDMVSFAGIQLQTGLSLGLQNIQSWVQADPIEETFTVDPDGSGPFFPYSVTIQLDPLVDIRFESTQFVLPLSLAGGARFFDTVELWAGGGMLFSWGENRLGIFGEEEITVLGSLADLQREGGEGVVEVDGYTLPIPPRLMQVYGRIQLNLDFEMLQIGIPLIIRLDHAVAGGLQVGVKL